MGSSPETAAKVSLFAAAAAVTDAAATAATAVVAVTAVDGVAVVAAIVDGGKSSDLRFWVGPWVQERSAAIDSY